MILFIDNINIIPKARANFEKANVTPHMYRVQRHIKKVHMENSESTFIGVHIQKAQSTQSLLHIRKKKDHLKTNNLEI